MFLVLFVVTGVAGLGLVGWWAADWWRAERWYSRQAGQVEGAVRAGTGDGRSGPS